MASLNLVPNTGLVITQACIFLTNMYAVKKLMVEPYLKLRDKRIAQTTGGQDQAKSIFKECSNTSESIDARIGKAYEDVKVYRVKTKSDASEKQQSMIAEAKVEAKAFLEDVQKQLASDVDAQQKKVPQIVNNLVNDTYAAVLK